MVSWWRVPGGAWHGLCSRSCLAGVGGACGCAAAGWAVEEGCREDVAGGGYVVYGVLEEVEAGMVVVVGGVVVVVLWITASIAEVDGWGLRIQIRRMA